MITTITATKNMKKALLIATGVRAVMVDGDYAGNYGISVTSSTTLKQISGTDYNGGFAVRAKDSSSLNAGTFVYEVDDVKKGDRFTVTTRFYEGINYEKLILLEVK